jgi:putative ABC transport system permease protein
MRRLRELILRFGGLFNKQRKDRELDDEIESHLQMHIDDNLRSGMTDEEARRQAMIKLGGIESTKEAYRDQRGLPLLEVLWKDIRYGLRMLRKNPGFTAVAVLTFSLGIGTTITVLSIVHNVILAPPPYPNPQRIVLVSPVRPDGQPHPRSWSAGHWDLFRQQAKSFDSLACYEWTFDFLVMPDGSESIGGMAVSKDYFEIIGAQPLLGRMFSEAELQPKSKETVIILSYDLWQRRFNGDPNIIGKSISLWRYPALTVIGVMPRGLRFLPSHTRETNYGPHSRVDYWLPAAPNPGKPQEGSLHLIGRLRESVSVEQALTEIASILPRYGAAPSDFEGIKASVQPLTRVLNADGERLLVPLVVSVALVFLIACGNVSGLLLARGLQRQQEYAVRSALGARPVTILRGVLVESFLLAGLGGVFGAALAASLLRLLGTVNGRGLPRLDGLTVGGTFAWITLGAATTAALLAGLLPALRVMRRPAATLLASATRTSSVGQRERWLLRGTAVLQIALTLALLAGAGLLIRTAKNLAAIKPGYQTEKILTMNVTLLKGNWFDFHVQALQRVAALPGVQSAAFGWGLPLTGNAWLGAVRAADEPAKTLKDWETISIRAVSPDYFDTMGMTIVAGRGIRTTDAGSKANGIPGDAPFVAVINQKLADTCFPGRDPLGKKLRLSWKQDEPEIIGVVSNTRTEALTQQSRSELYFSLWQASAWVKHLVVRTEGDPRKLAVAVQRELRSIDPAVAIEQVKTLSEIRQDSVAVQTFTMRLLVGFSFGAGMLALVGLYGVLSVTVGSRRKEIAIRSALGAQKRDILRLILGEGLRLMASGLLLGTGVSLLLGKLLNSLLFGVHPADPATLIGATLLFAAVGLVACWMPARRAAKVDPVVALRCE